MGRGLGNGSPAPGGAAEGSCPTPARAEGGSSSPLARLLAGPRTYPSIAEPDKASLTRTEPRSQRDTQAARKWRPGPDGNCRRCRSARGSARPRRRRKEPSAPAPGGGRRAAGRGDEGEWAPPPLPLPPPPPRRRAPGALRPPPSAPGPAAGKHGALASSWMLLEEVVPVVLREWCGRTPPNPPQPGPWISGGAPRDCRTAPRQLPLFPPNRVPAWLLPTYGGQGKTTLWLSSCAICYLRPFSSFKTKIKKLDPVKEERYLVKTILFKASRCHQTETGFCFQIFVVLCQVEEILSVEDQ